MMKRIIFILISVIALASCRSDMQGDDALLDRGIKVFRYDRLQYEATAMNSIAAVQRMSLDCPQATRILIEDVLMLGKVDDPNINERMCAYYTDSVLFRLMLDAEEKFDDMRPLEEALTEGFKKLKEEVPSIPIPSIYSQISALNQSIVVGDSLLGFSIDKYMGEDYPLYKKYYYALKEHPNSIVITIDDDEIYPRNLIEGLYTVHKKFPNCVIAARAHKIRFNNGIVENYNNWEWESTLSHVPSMRLVATGCGGVLYPPFCMDSRVFDLELITKLSINADDLWLKIMQVLKHTPVVICNNVIRKKRVSVYGSQNKALNSSNVVQQFNDIYMNNLIDYFNLSEEDFSDE